VVSIYQPGTFQDWCLLKWLDPVLDEFDGEDVAAESASWRNRQKKTRKRKKMKKRHTNTNSQVKWNTKKFKAGGPTKHIEL
jgi:hypothetical protein